MVERGKLEDDLTKRIIVALQVGSCYSAYIADRVRKSYEYRQFISASVVRVRLSKLERDGYAKRGFGPNGSYGYWWALTDAGRNVFRTLLAEAGTPT